MAGARRPDLTAVATTAIASAAGLAAMFLYPGGTALDHGTTHYELTRNFLSDLGMTVAHDGQPNRAGAVLFVIAMAALVLGGIGSLVPLMRSLARVPAARGWMRAAALCAAAAGVSFAGVAMTPENRAMAAHVAFTQWGWAFVALLPILLGGGAARAGAGHERVAFLAFTTGAILTAYRATMIFGPECCATDAGLRFHVVAQKCAVVVVLAALLLISSLRQVDSSEAP